MQAPNCPPNPPYAQPGVLSLANIYHYTKILHKLEIYFRDCLEHSQMRVGAVKYGPYNLTEITRDSFIDAICTTSSPQIWIAYNRISRDLVFDFEDSVKIIGGVLMLAIDISKISNYDDIVTALHNSQLVEPIEWLIE